MVLYVDEVIDRINVLQLFYFARESCLESQIFWKINFVVIYGILNLSRV